MWRITFDFRKVICEQSRISTMRSILRAGVLLISINVFIILIHRPIREIFLPNSYNGSAKKGDASSSIQEHVTEASALTVCQRKVPSLHIFETNNIIATIRTSKSAVIIGHDTMNHVQTNNHINAIFHAMDYALDNNSTLILIRNGWSMNVLTMLFQGISHHNNSNNTHDWELELYQHAGVSIESQEDIPKKYHDWKIKYLGADEAYYYHTNIPVKEILERRTNILRYLWTHPTNSLCTVVETAIPHDEKYTVIHSRWMKNDGCKKRLGSLSHRIKTKMTNNKKRKQERANDNNNVTHSFNLDRNAPCLLNTEYIEQIVNATGMVGKPILIISDGLNPSISSSLKAHTRIGPYIQTVTIPGNTKSTVGNDLMLGILANVFIGTPISTMSGSIARARIALGFDPMSNFLFPIQRPRSQVRNEDGTITKWDFVCQNEECLYDVNVLNHYVG